MPNLTQEFKYITYSTTDGVATLTLNRPDKLNSFTVAMHLEVRDALARVKADNTVRVLVLTGAGRGFCAGQDLNDPAMAEGVDVGAVVERFYLPLALRIRTMPVPVVAAVNGVAAGAGANFALGCDMVIAARSASFIQAFSKIGLVPDCGGTWLLPRLVGRARALARHLSGCRARGRALRRHPHHRCDQHGHVLRRGRGARCDRRRRFACVPARVPCNRGPLAQPRAVGD